MKLRLIGQLRKALLVYMASCTVQADMPVDSVTRGSVLFVCPPAAEQSGAAEEEEAEVCNTAATSEDTGSESLEWQYGRPAASGVDSQGRPLGKAGKTEVYTINSDEDYAFAALINAIRLAWGAGESRHIVYLDNRGKGTVAREVDQESLWPMGIWNETADYFGHHSNAYHFFNIGYSAVWVHSGPKIPAWYPANQTLTGNTQGNTGNHGTTTGGTATGTGYTGGTASYAPAPSVPSAGGFGGGSYRPSYTPKPKPVAPAPAPVPGVLNPAGGSTLTVTDTSVLTGDWLLDLNRPVELDYSASTAPLTLGGTLNIMSGSGLTLNLQGRWDGASAGTFDLISLGAGGALQLDGSELAEGRDYLPALDSFSILYTDAHGNTATLDPSAGDGLSYALRLQDGKLSLIVSEPAKTTGLFIGPNAYSIAPAAALPMLAAADPGEPAGQESFTWTAGQGDFTWAEGSAWGGQGAYTPGADVLFTDNGDDTTDTQAVALGGSVTAGALTVSGTDTYNFSLGDNSITATEFTKTGSGTLSFDSGTGSITAETITISGGSVTTNAAVNATSGITVSGDAENSVSFTTTGAVTTPSIRVDGASMSVNQAITGLQSLTLANGATMNNAGNNAITFQPRTALRVEGQTHSTLMGDWTIDASKAFVLDFSAEYTSSINIASGTLTITGTRSATNVNNSLILDLGAKWDGTGDFSREIFSVGSAGRIVIDGAEIASGDQIAHFSHLYLRYSDRTGTIHTIDLSGAGNETSADLHYGLDWSGTSLTFSVVHTSEDARTPFVWQHSNGANLTWKEGGAWGNPDNIYRSTGSNNVLFKSDGDTKKDDVTITINGTVAPGDIGDGVAGIRVMGDDNFIFQGQNNASIANYTTEKDGEQVVIATTLTKTGSGTLTIKDNVSLDYTGRTEVLGGTMYVQYHKNNAEGTVHRWTPSGTVVVGINGTLKMGSGTTSLQDDVIWLGDSLFENDGSVTTNILKTTGTEIAGRGQWQAAFMLLE